MDLCCKYYKQRYRQARVRQHGEVCDQLWSRLELISQNKAHIEYFREIAEILANEAKDLLTGTSTIAGMFEGPTKYFLDGKQMFFMILDCERKQNC